MTRYLFKIGKVKFFHKPNKHESYLVSWPWGYLQGWNEWDQLAYKRFNWITFVLIEFEIERALGDGFNVELGLLGFRLRFHSLWKDGPLMDEIKERAKEVKKDFKTMSKKELDKKYKKLT